MSFKNRRYNLPAGRQVWLVFSSLLLQIIVFFLPTQLGLHFWPDFSRAAGIKVDYLSPTLYFTDLLLITFCILSFRLIFPWLRHHLSTVLVFLLFILLNSFLGISPLNSLLWWSRNLLYFLFFLTLRLRKTSWSEIKSPLLISTLLIISLEIYQLFHQGSAGGLFYWLGERAYSSSTPGLGRLTWFGLDLVRPQSTFSHPNSLAGFLLTVFYLFYRFKAAPWSKLLIFIGIILAFSKASLLAFLLVFTFQINSIFLIFLFLFVGLGQVILPSLVNSYQFISDRLFLLPSAKTIILSSPLFGVGLGNFIPALSTLLPGSFLLPAKLQPVHNLFLLVLSEVGLIGAYLTVKVFRKFLLRLLQPRFLLLLALVAITGAFDHYWWTLPQNKLILLLAAAVL